MEAFLMIEKNENIFSKNIEGKLFLIDFDSSSVMELNKAGEFIWNCLPHHPAGEISEKLALEFEVTLPQAQKDVTSFLKELKRHGLIQTKEVL